MRAVKLFYGRRGDGGTHTVSAGLAEAAGSEGKGEWDMRLAR